jgi:hypothetical protein
MDVFNKTTVQIIDNQNNKKMKTKVFSILAIAALAFGTVNLSKAATVKNNDQVSVLANTGNINNIEIYGNVEVYVSDGPADQVKVYNRYYGENALVQNVNGTLRISSYKAEKLVVWVTAADLRGISAYDNAEVKSFGKLSEINLDVNLYNNASAKLNLDVYSADINVNNTAKADLSGTVSELDLKYDHSTTINQTNLVATNSTQVDKTAKSETEELLAGL